MIDSIESDQRKLWKRDDLTLDEKVALNDKLFFKKQSYWKQLRTKEQYNNPVVAGPVFTNTTPTRHGTFPPPYKTVGTPQRLPATLRGEHLPAEGPKRKLFGKTLREPLQKQTRFKPSAVPPKTYNLRPKAKPIQTGKGTPLLQRYAPDSEYTESLLINKDLSTHGRNIEYRTNPDVSYSIESASNGGSEQTEMSNTESEASDSESGETSNASATETEDDESKNYKYENNRSFSKLRDPINYNTSNIKNDPGYKALVHFYENRDQYPMYIGGRYAIPIKIPVQKKYK